MSSEQTQNGCLNHDFKWKASEDLKEAHMLMNSVLSCEDLNLIMLQRHKKTLTQKIYQRLHLADNIKIKLFQSQYQNGVLEDSENEDIRMILWWKTWIKTR